MRKLKTLIKFMRMLLIMILFKSVVLIFEAVFLLANSSSIKEDVKSLDLYVTAVCEFLNWTTT
jgi:hypothetical protein